MLEAGTEIHNRELGFAHGAKSWPLTPMQRAMLADTAGGPKPGLNTLQIVWTLSEQTDTARLRQAAQRLVDRHEGLRTYFSWSDSVDPFQSITRQAPLVFRVLDHTRENHEHHESRLKEFLCSDRADEFDLRTPPLIRFAVVQTSTHTVVVITAHHMVIDGRCVPLILGELWTGLSIRPEQAASPESISEYWEQCVARQTTTTELQEWRKELSRFEVGSSLTMLASPTSINVDAKSGIAETTLSATATAALTRLANSQNLKTSTWIEAAWSVLMSRYSRTPGVVYGSTRAEKISLTPPFNETIGMMVNTLPIAVSARPEANVLEYCREIRSAQENLKERMHFDAMSSRSDVTDQPFESLVAFHPETYQAALARQLPELKDTTFEVIQRPAVSLALLAFGGVRLKLQVLYDPSNVDDETAERLVGQVANLLRHLPESIDERLADWPCTTEAERRKVVQLWNQTDRPYPKDQCVHHGFESWVRQTPEAIAVDDGVKRLTYAELNTMAQRGAADLRRVGLTQGAVVGVLLSRTVELPAVLLGILKAGCTYVPFDHCWPATRIREIIETLGITDVVACTNHLGLMSEAAKTCPALKRVWRPSQKQYSENAAESPMGWTDTAALCDLTLTSSPQKHLPESPSASNPDTPAYIIFTSGSTGKPKGVSVSHRPVANLFDWVNRTFQVGPGDRLLFVTSLCFDLSVYDLFGIFAAGATVRIASAHELADPHRVRDLIDTEAITFWDSAPAHLNQVMYLPRNKACQPNKTTLRLVFLSGDWIPLDLPTQIHRDYAQAKVVALGGATEATVWSNWFEVEAVDSAWPSIPYGRPIQNARYYILDDHLQPCPVGMPGELFIGGSCLAEGYAGDPKRTQDRFLIDPYGPCSKEKMYRTGDLARWKPEGVIELLGRIDNQVKIRGYRIELGEVEAALRLVQGVSEAAVSVNTIAPGQAKLVAYIVMHTGEKFCPHTIRQNLIQRLPSYMVPAMWVQLSSLPTNSNGKVDRKTLPDPVFTPDECEETFEPPIDKLEHIVAESFAERLGLEPRRVGRMDDFFALGGDSLDVLGLTISLEGKVGCAVPHGYVFDASTVRDLAALLRDISDTARHGHLTWSTERVASAPAVYMQRGVWLLSHQDPSAGHYNEKIVLCANKPLDQDRLQQSLRSVVDRHDALRTTFQRDRDILTQRVHDYMPVVLETLRADSKTEAQAAALEFASRPFDLQTGPAFRFACIRVAGQDTFVGIFSHAITDHASLQVICEEITTFYKDRASTPPTPSFQQAHLANWFEAHARQPDWRETNIEYWTAQLEHIRPLDIPSDRARPARPSHRGGIATGSMSSEQAKLLRNLVAAEQTTPYVALLAAWSIWLYRCSGQSDFAVGVPASMRPTAGFEHTVGCLLNNLAIPVSITNGCSFREILRSTKRVVAGTQDFHTFPFEEIVQTLNRSIDVSRNPLYDTMLLYYPEKPGAYDAGETILTREDRWLPAHSSKLDLTAYINAKNNGGLELGLEYALDLFDPATARRFANQFLRLLESAIQNPNIAVDDLEWVDPEEYRRVIIDWNQTAAPLPEAATLHELVSTTAKHHPERIAFKADGGVPVTYRDWERRANQLAHYLVEFGIGPDIVVGVCLERGTPLMVTLLAILKAGGAYVPLDPDFPPARIRQMIDLAHPAAIITASETADVLDKTDRTPTILVDRDADLIAHRSQAAPVATSGPDHLAYVIFTSGSTGKPKGVMVNHRAIVNHLSWMQRTMSIRPNDVMLQATPFSFDISLCELFLSALVGAQVVIAKPGGHRDPRYLMDLCNQEQVTTIQCVPTTLTQLLSRFECGQSSRTLKRILCGGEAWPPELADRVLANLNIDLYNLYGPTEATVWASYYRCKSGDAGSALSIGRPIDNTRMYVLDDKLKPVPIGVTGELYIGGVGVARGYINQPELTAERFLQDPFTDEADVRMYRTGDLASWKPDGNLRFHGRVDSQIKLRGHRIELGEVEAALRNFKEVALAAVSVKSNRLGQDQLVGYVVMQPHLKNPRSANALRRSLQARLPSHMIPSTILIVNELPINSNGKVDRKLLPDPESETLAREDHIDPPKGVNELALEGIFKAALGRSNVKLGRQDRFFDSGGDSLSALSALIHAENHGFTFTLEDLIDKSLDDLAVIRESSSIHLDNTISVPNAGQEEFGQAYFRDSIPLSPSQRWVLNRNFINPERYGFGMWLQPKQKLDADALNSAWGMLHKRHEGLCIEFDNSSITWSQRLVSPEKFATLRHIRAENHKHLCGREFFDRIAQQIITDIRLDRAPSPRMALINDPEDSQWVFIYIPHLLIDALSVQVLLADLVDIYSRLIDKRIQPQTSEQSVSFIKWCDYLSTYGPSLATEDAEAWLAQPWKDTIQIPRQSQEHITNTYASARDISVKIQAEQTSLLRRVSEKYNVTFESLLVSAFIPVVTQWVNSSTDKAVSSWLALDITGNGRESLGSSPDTHHSLGFFSTIFPVLFPATHTVCVDGLADTHRRLKHAPGRGNRFGILRDLHPDFVIRERVKATPSPEIKFNYHGSSNLGPLGGLLRPAEIGLPPMLSPDDHRAYLLNIEASHLGDDLHIQWRYNEEIHSKMTVNTLAANYVSQLQQMVDFIL